LPDQTHKLWLVSHVRGFSAKAVLGLVHLISRRWANLLSLQSSLYYVLTVRMPHRTADSSDCIAVVPVTMGANCASVAARFEAVGFQLTKFMTVVVEGGTTVLHFCIAQRNADGVERDDWKALKCATFMF
jgi:hypothetical protein